MVERTGGTSGRLENIFDSLGRLITPDVRGSERFRCNPLAIYGIIVASMPIGFGTAIALGIGAEKLYEASQLPAGTRFLAGLPAFLVGWFGGGMAGMGAIWRLSARIASLNLPKSQST